MNIFKKIASELNIRSFQDVIAEVNNLTKNLAKYLKSILGNKANAFIINNNLLNPHPYLNAIELEHDVQSIIEELDILAQKVPQLNNEEISGFMTDLNSLLSEAIDAQEYFYKKIDQKRNEIFNQFPNIFQDSLDEYINAFHDNDESKGLILLFKMTNPISNHLADDLFDEEIFQNFIANKTISYSDGFDEYFDLIKKDISSFNEETFMKILLNNLSKLI